MGENQTEKDVAKFTKELRKLTTKDRGHADVFNALFGVLNENDVFLKENLEEVGTQAKEAKKAAETLQLYAYKVLGDEYVMTSSDFDQVGFYQIHSLADLVMESGVNNAPSSNVGDYKVVALNANPNFQTLLLTSPRYANEIYIGRFWNQEWVGWEKIATIEDLKSKLEKIQAIYNKGILTDEDITGSAFTNRSWTGVGLGLANAPVSGWITYLCLGAGHTGSDINRMLAMESAVDSHLYFTVGNKGQSWVRALDTRDFQTNLSNPNLLINADFTNPVNQRNFKKDTGYFLAGGCSYFIDRWNCSNTFPQVALQESGVLITNTKGYTHFGLCQILDSLEAGIYTFSFEVVGLAKPEAFTEFKAYSRDFQNNRDLLTQDIKKSIGISSFTFTVPKKTNQVHFMVFAKAADSLNNYHCGFLLKWCKLEKGSVATAFVSPDPTIELLKCQRYCYQLSAVTNESTYLVIANAQGFSANTRYLYGSIRLPVRMRTMPTVSCHRLMARSHTKSTWENTIVSVELSEDWCDAEWGVIGVCFQLEQANGEYDFYSIYANSNGEDQAYFYLDAELR